MAGRKRFRAAVIGGSGYGGAEMIRRLLLHPDVELCRVASVDLVGEPLGAAHPSLEGRTDLVFQDIAPSAAADGMDVVLLGLPHKVTARKVPEIAALPSVKVVDMSGDFRLRDAAAYETYYGQPHPHPEMLADFVYGLPELNRDRIRRARFVASPGCFATTIELGLLPLARAGILEGVVHVQGITGSSGSGAAPQATTHHPVRAGNLRAYKPLWHQHVPEIEETLASAGRSRPAAPLRPGLGAAGARDPRHRLRRAPRGVDRRAALDRSTATPSRASRSCGFRRAGLPEVAAVSGSNFAEVGVAAGPAWRGRRTVTVVSAIDNLIKGGAGQAIQNMNLVLGLDERASLEDPGPWPP